VKLRTIGGTILVNLHTRALLLRGRGAVRSLSRCHIRSASLQRGRSLPLFGRPRRPSFPRFTRRRARARLRPDTTNFEVNSEIMGCQLRAPWRTQTALHHHQQQKAWRHELGKVTEFCGRVVSLMID